MSVNPTQITQDEMSNKGKIQNEKEIEQHHLRFSLLIFF